MMVAKPCHVAIDDVGEAVNIAGQKQGGVNSLQNQEGMVSTSKLAVCNCWLTFSNDGVSKVTTLVRMRKKKMLGWTNTLPMTGIFDAAVVTDS